MSSEIPEARSMRTNIGVTAAGAEALARLVAEEWFTTNIDAFRFGFAYALANEISASTEPPGAFTEMTWNVGSVDPDGRIMSLVDMQHPSDDPWDAIRRLGDAGVRAIVERGVHLGSPTDVLGMADD